jgi:hypothetical protein
MTHVSSLLTKNGYKAHDEHGGWPEREPVHLNVQSERGQYHVVSYRELSVTYEGEHGEAIPAYLLIPTHTNPPYPAVVANHQCYQDCDIGKDAVVGKAHRRPDQAYAFELVIKKNKARTTARRMYVTIKRFLR